jgi:hypothetical protein
MHQFDPFGDIHRKYQLQRQIRFAAWTGVALASIGVFLLLVLP